MIDFDRNLGFSHRVLDAMAVRANVALHNLANQNTPGFKRYRVAFEEHLRAAQSSGQPAADVHPVVERDMSGAPGLNNVAPTEELALLDKVRLLHELFSRRVGGWFQNMNKAIRGQ
jgi:flagellar basal body rod protein FlgB